MKMNELEKWAVLVLALSFLAFRPSAVRAMTIRDRLAAPIQTLYGTPTAALSEVTVGYALTFQKSGQENRLIGVVPLLNWGIISLDFLAGTPDLSQLWNHPGLIGFGGGIHLDRVLTAMFPELETMFKGDVPFTNGKISYSLEPGAGAGFDVSAKQAVQALYVGAGLQF